MTDIPRDIPLDRWLPTSRDEMQSRGWDRADVIIVSGDAYVDHPSFGTAVIGRLLESLGLMVAVLPQPNWRDDLRDFHKLGEPGLFFAVTAGCMDSLVNHYTAAKRRRSDDAYTAGGRAGQRPDYAVTVYSNILKKLFPGTPVIVGGIEASLRRLTHYDFWSDSFKPGILSESGADLLVYGMGEKPLTEIVRLLQRGVPFAKLDTVAQTALLRNRDDVPRQKNWQDQLLHAHEVCCQDKTCQAENFARVETESNLWSSTTRFLQPIKHQMLIINPPAASLDTDELDRVFELPYTRLPHPRYRKKGEIPAYEMIKNSLTIHRGCFGGCSFCTISAHQGKFITSRSERSILREIDLVTDLPGFTGTISDLGGPSANMYRMAGKVLEQCQRCQRPSCLHPAICPNLDTRHRPLLDLYQQVEEHPQVKHLFIGSGLRYDLFLQPTTDEELAKDHDDYLEALISRHVSGRLKVAPEHSSASVLMLMRKPSFDLFVELKRRFDEICRRRGLQQQLIPYLISGHPGSGLAEMAELAERTREMGYTLEQVQLFTPTPMTLATEIFATGLDPHSGQAIDSAVSDEARKDQHRLLFWYQPEKRQQVISSLRRAGLHQLATRFERNDNRPAHDKKLCGRAGQARRPGKRTDPGRKPQR